MMTMCHDAMRGTRNSSHSIKCGSKLFFAWHLGAENAQGAPGAPAGALKRNARRIPLSQLRAPRVPEERARGVLLPGGLNAAHASPCRRAGPPGVRSGAPLAAELLCLSAKRSRSLARASQRM